jgi:CHAT domain-containing protein
LGLCGIATGSQACAATTKAEALRAAQLGLLADPATAHPSYWAPFVAIGDWR